MIILSADSRHLLVKKTNGVLLHKVDKNKIGIKQQKYPFSQFFINYNL